MTHSIGSAKRIDVRCYNGCIVDRVRFHTSERNFRRTTQNSGVIVIGESSAFGNGDNNFYGVLDEVLYIQFSMEEVFGYLSVGGTISSFPSKFDKTNVMFLKLLEDLNNSVAGSSSVGDNSDEFNEETTQPSLTPRRYAQSRFLELEFYVIDMCLRKIFPLCCLRWVDVGREYIEVVKGNVQHFFVLDFKDQAMNRFIEHQMLSTFKEFMSDFHKHFTKYKEPEKARANPLHVLVEHMED
ncbi:CACTA en-spm transposon protein [Cucumis melo var. makuwa]|uniref:CACTA en-spm transposon protein n=1 Tax=Cucumis melo var. makuwa TaxID=1194695 RepID=A0A5D3DFF0_CUCMM|nr:CACTA en-spm transposon protein [Cucumis melo var. makuwa]